MAVRKVLTYPNSLLKLESAEIIGITHETKLLIDDMIDTMLESGHSTGIAAPQIGAATRIVVADASLGRKPSPNHGRLIMLNPEIIRHEGSVISREGCMSVPEYTGNVTRAEKISVQYHDENFKLRIVEAYGFESILLQHEIDHLDGILFVDRVISRRTDLFRRKR
ncbi:MAG: peptide deformylase [Deferribacteraceae bacterium]|jgi:peptide deformylase|nr:peptide deformylase [Deferribacteraceae bacterium]